MTDLADIDPSDYEQLVRWAGEHPPEERTREQNRLLNKKIQRAWDQRRAVYHATNRVAAQN